MQQILNVLGPEGSKYVVWVLVALGVAIGLALLIWLGFAVFGRSLNMSSGSGRGQPQRLGITGAFNIDRKGRKLVIVRRDNVEHLIMIGGPNDVLVESNIVRAERPERTVRAPARPGATEPQDVALVETTTPVVVPPAPVATPPQPKPVAQPPVAPPAPAPEPKPVMRPPVAPPQAAPQPAPRPAPAVPQAAPVVPQAAPVMPVQAPKVAAVAHGVPPQPPHIPTVNTQPPPVPPPTAAPAPRRPATDPMLSDMAKRLQSVLQRPAQPAPRKVDPVAEAGAETIPIPLPSARPAQPAAEAPAAPKPHTPPPAAPAAPVPPKPAMPAAPPPAPPVTPGTPVTQGKTVPVPSPRTETPTIDSLEEEMARLLGRPGPDKA